MTEIALEEGYAAVGGHLRTLEGHSVSEILQCLGRLGEVQPSVAVHLVVLVDEAQEQFILGFEWIDDTAAALVVSTLVNP